jgi:hypothetical protein
MSEKALVILECKEACENTQLFPLNPPLQKTAGAYGLSQVCRPLTPRGC